MASRSSSAEILEFAKEGTYSLSGSDHHTARDQQGLSIFERVTPIELGVIFDRQGDQLKVKPWLKEGIRWHCGSVDDPSLPTVLGPQDIVVANCFLRQMQPASAERCLRNVARLVKPGGCLFASGVDLDVRAKVAKELRWEPITEMMKEVYEGDRTLSDGWPTYYWAIEPFWREAARLDDSGTSPPSDSASRHVCFELTTRAERSGLP